jgi:hypothetical protein
MSFFQRNHYKSETTLFIEDLKKANPKLEEQQLAGRALLWDKQIDRPLQADINAGKVPQSAYVYQTK